MKKWKSGKNREELYLLGKPVCVLHYHPEFGYHCEAQIGNGILGQGFGFCTGPEARINTEAWYAAQMRNRYQMHRECAKECSLRLSALQEEDKVK